MLSKNRASLCIPLVFLAATANLAMGQTNGRKHGFLGVYVVEGDRGMVITDFINGTPAYKLFRKGKIDVDYTIVSLAGQATDSLQDLREARDSIPKNKEGRLVFLDDDGDEHFVWINPHRSGGGVAASPKGAAMSSGDDWSMPMRGNGSDQGNFRDARSDDRESENPDIR